jgi:hypothetical protein
MENLFLHINKYDIRPFLPVIAGRIIQNRDVSNRFLYDFRRTIADLINNNHYKFLSELAKKDNLMIHPESGGPHPAPIDALMNVGINDVPMGEFWIRAATHRITPESRLYVKQPASAAHIYGHRFVQAEGPTSIGPHWEEDFAYMKPTLDRVYCEGLNRLVIHTFTHSPKEAGTPGNEYFAGTHFNPNVTWWQQAKTFLQWNSRISYMLSQGLFVGDVCYYYGDNAPNQVPLKHQDPSRGEGYDYDVCNTDVILNRMNVRDGKIILPDGMSYEVLVLPANRSAIRAEVFDKITEMVNKGATVIAPKPLTSVGLQNREEQERKINAEAEKIWGKSPAEAGKHPFGKGAVYSPTSIRQVLYNKGVSHDFLCASQPGATIDYIHRRTSDADIYYIANRNDRPEYIRAEFRVQGKTPELWNPETGEIIDCSIYDVYENHTRIPLSLDPFGSTFVVFRKPSAEHYDYISHNNQTLFPELPRDTFPFAPYIQTTENNIIPTLSGEYILRKTSGTKQKIIAKADTILISSTWNVSFASPFDEKHNITLNNLVRWENHPDTFVRYYSGTAEYVNTIELTAEQLSGKTVYLNLGAVHNMAEVFVNEKYAGLWWHFPFANNISPLLKVGRNDIRLRIVNLWPNRLIGDARLPENRRRTRTNIIKFTADTPLYPSGLEGPVSLMFLTSFN